MAAWKPGFVKISPTGNEERIAVGQKWLYSPIADGELGPNSRPPSIPFEVVAVTHLGEVVLRPLDRTAYEQRFPLTEITVKGKTETVRVSPFQWISAKYAETQAEIVRKAQEQRKHQKDPEKIRAIDHHLAEIPAYAADDMSAHEAWDVWTSMELSANPPASNPSS